MISPATCRFRVADLATVPAGDGELLVHRPSADLVDVLPGRLVEALQRCGEFRTVPDHAERLGRALRLPAGALGSLRSDLAWAAERGYLVSVEEIQARGSEALASGDGPARIGTIGVVTCGAPDLLDRAITSLSATGPPAGGRTELVVVDDGRDACRRAEARARLRDLGERLGVRLRYADREDRRRFVTALSRETGTPPEVVEFALLDPEGVGDSRGANRNALLLDGAGDLLLSVDDDVVWRAARMPGAEPGAAATSAVGPLEWWFFPDRAAALAAVGFDDLDVVGAHAQLLGRSAAAGLAAAAQGVAPDLGGASPALLGALAAGRGRVMVTMVGRVGDCALTDPVPLTVGGASRDRLVASEGAYRLGTTGREIVRGVTRATIGDQLFCSTMAIGLDARELLPPFFPLMRGEDVSFGGLLRVCLDDVCLALLPLVLLHAPAGDRTFAPEDVWQRRSEVDTMRLVLDCAGSFVPGPALPAGRVRMRALGEHLMALGDLEPPDFARFLRERQWVRLAGRIGHLEQVLDEHDGWPPYWAEDARRHIDWLRGAMLDEGSVVPLDLRRGRGVEEARALARRLVARFGALLRAWPDLVEGARRLRARGERLARLL